MANRAKSDRYAQIMCVHDWLHDKQFSNKTLHKLIEQKFGLKTYASRAKLIKEAMAALSSGWEKETVRVANLERLDFLIEKAAEAGRFKDSAEIIRMVNRMYGLDTTKADVNISGEVFELEF